MKRSKITKKILTIILLVTCIVIFAGTSYAAVNDMYSGDQVVIETDLSGKVESSILLDALGNLIYALACLGEFLIGVIFEAVAKTIMGGGEATFPWADAIVFNSVELLDVNFLNSANGSIVSVAKEYLSKIYATAFGIGISFFSVASLIMGIKIALSTIAAEKAKYKEAVGQWMLGLVMMFTLHFTISFIFYLNEELVKIASGIATDAMENATYAENLQIEQKSESVSERAKEVVDYYISQMKEDDWGFGDDFRDRSGQWELVRWRAYKDRAESSEFPLITLVVSMDTLNSTDVAALMARYHNNAYEDFFEGGSALGFEEDIDDLVEKDNYKTIENLLSDPDMGDKYYEIAAKLLASKFWVKYRATEISADWRVEDEGFLKDIDHSNGDGYIYLLFYDVDNVINDNKIFYEKMIYLVDNFGVNSKWKLFANEMINFIDACHGRAENEQKSLIYNLAYYFKESSWGVAAGAGWGHEKIIIQNAILFAILVVQSFMFLLSYAKRVFYVIILALMAPLIVIYDFFNKAFRSKGGGALANWLKEFCTLVFIQTLQAFIYAFTLSLILSIQFGEIEVVENRNAGIGILAVIALASVFKIEALIKKIIGFDKSRADVKGALQSLGKTAIAWHFGKKVLDNGAKVAGGLAGIASAGSAKRKLNSDYKKMLTQGDSGSGASDSGGSDSGASGSGGSGSGGSPSSKPVTAKQLSDDYNKRLAEIRKQRADGAKSLLKGTLETAGAITGGVAGGLIGISDGEVDDLMQGISVGAGIGDTIGGKTADTAIAGASLVSSTGRGLKSGYDAAARIYQAVKNQEIDGKGLEKARNLGRAYLHEARKNHAKTREIQDLLKKANDANADNAN